MAGILELAEMDVPELEIVPDGEYKLEIAKARPTTFNSGREGYEVILRIVDHENAANIFHNVNKPMEGDPPATERMMIIDVQAFVKAFKITSENTDDWIGLQSWASVESDQYEGRDKNVVSKFLPPK